MMEVLNYTIYWDNYNRMDENEHQKLQKVIFYAFLSQLVEGWIDSLNSVLIFDNEITNSNGDQCQSITHHPAQVQVGSLLCLFALVKRYPNNETAKRTKRKSIPLPTILLRQALGDLYPCCQIYAIPADEINRHT